MTKVTPGATNWPELAPVHDEDMKRATAALLIVSALVLTSCAEPNRDPRVDVVDVDGRTTKVCDGPNLVYTAKVFGGKSVSVVADSPECVR